MLLDTKLDRAQAALSALGHFACYYDEEADIPPQDFGFGLSVILGYIEDDIREVYNECTKPKGAEE
jgi:hypothetical protein